MSSTAPSSRSPAGERAPTAAAQLHRLIDLLSDEERAYLLDVVGDVAAGERFWEGDFGLLYNEHAKLRYFKRRRDAPTAPAVEHDGFVPISLTKSYPDAPRVRLPEPSPLPGALGEVLGRRRSRRSYTGEPIDPGRLSTLLHHACGISAAVPAYGFDRLPLRTFPTHGGLQSPEVYLCVPATGGVDAGLYHYEPRSHSLALLQPGDLRPRLRQLAYDEAHVAAAAAVLLVTVVYDRLRWKYGDRAYRFACTDAGFLGENVYLAAEAMGLGACALSGFAQDATEALLGVDGKHELALLMITIGVQAAGG